MVTLIMLQYPTISYDIYVYYYYYIHKAVMLSITSVLVSWCLPVCLSVNRITQKARRQFHENLQDYRLL